MAGESVVGALRVVLGLDTASFEDGLNKGAKAADSFGKRVAAIGAGIGLERIVESATHSIIHFTTAQFESIDALGKTAQKVGIAVEEFSSLNFAAKLADVSTESLATGLGKLSKNMAEAALGGGDAKKTFDALGISVTDANGKLKPVNEVLAELADKFQKAPDGVNKTAAAMILLGKSGKELIPLLNDGSHGLKEMDEIAEKLGLKLSKDTVAAVQKFNDNLKILSSLSEGFANLVIAQIVPALVGLSDQFVKTAIDSTLMRDNAKRVGDAILELIVIFNQAVAINTVLGTALKELQELFVAFPTDVDRANEAVGNIKEIFSKLPDILKAAREEIDGFLKLTVNAKPALKDFDVGTSKFADTINNLALRTRVLRGDFDKLAPNFAEQAVKLKLTDDAAKTLTTTVDGLKGKTLELNNALLAFRGAQVTQDVLLPWQQYNDQIAKLQVLFNAGVISADTFALASKKAAESTGQAWNLAASEIVGSLATGLKAFAAQNKSLAGVAKAAAIAQALINTYTAATKALATYPPPLSYVAAAAAVVAGLGYVSQIQSQNFQTGGSFQVGGTGGIDSQQVMINATPGEMVSIRRPDSGGSGMASEVTLRGLGPNEFFTGDMMRELVNSLNRAHADGYKLKVAEG